MLPPPTHPFSSPDPNPPVKKLRAGGTPPGAPPPPRAGPPPSPAQQGASNPAATGISSSSSTFTMKVDDAMSTRRAELLRLRQKTAPTKPAAPPGRAASQQQQQGSPKPSTEALLNRARAQLPPPPPQNPQQQQHSVQGRSAPTGPPPPTMPAPDLNHFRRTSDIFPEVTRKADPARSVPPVLPTTTPAGMMMMSPPLQGVTPAVPRNLDPAFAHNVQTSGNGTIPPSAPPPPTTAPPPAAASRSKSVPPPQRLPGDAEAHPPVPKSPGSGGPGEEPRRSHRPPPPGRPKAAPLEPLHPASMGSPPFTAAAATAPPPKGPPPPPQHRVNRSEAKPPSLVEELSPNSRKISVFQPASAPASMTIPNGVDHLGKGSSHSHASDKSQEAPGSSRASLDDHSMTRPPAERKSAAGPPPTSMPGSSANMPPPPVSPIKSNPTLPPNKGVPPARVPSLMVDTRSGPDAMNSFFVGGSTGMPPNDPPTASLPPTQGRSVATDHQAHPPSSSSVLFQAEQYLASSTTTTTTAVLDLDEVALMEGAKTPPINNRSSVELRMQSELAQLQKDKAYALRRVVELEGELYEQQQQARASGEGAGADASGVLQMILHLAETQGEGAALGWAQDQLGKNGSGIPGGTAPFPRPPPVLPRPRRGPSAADLPPEALRSAAERVEHEYVADCATFVVRRPYGLAEERELWFKTGQMPAKKYAEAASASQVSTIEVAAIVRADESLLSVSGPHLVRHESNGEWHDFGDAPEKGEPLGIVFFRDGNTGEVIQYSLDEVYEGAVAVREQYCLSVLSTAAGIHAGSKAGPKEKEASKPDSAVAEKDAAPSPAPQGDSAVTFGALLSALWSGLLSLFFNCFIVFPMRVFSFTLVTLVSVVLLSILWLYIADEDAMGRSGYWYNAPGVM